MRDAKPGWVRFLSVHMAIRAGRKPPSVPLLAQPPKIATIRETRRKERSVLFVVRILLQTARRDVGERTGVRLHKAEAFGFMLWLFSKLPDDQSAFGLEPGQIH
jgi:hypothetical protein